MQQLILFLLSQQCEQPIIAVELVTSTYTQIHQQKFKNFKTWVPIISNLDSEKTQLKLTKKIIQSFKI
jgi:hypothetical protein